MNHRKRSCFVYMNNLFIETMSTSYLIPTCVCGWVWVGVGGCGWVGVCFLLCLLYMF